jgi:glutamate-1-semialdehyde aminotransferase
MPAGQTGEVAGVIIDPSPSKKARVYPIRDFVAHVKSSG